MPEIEFGTEFNEKDAFIDLDHYRRLVHTYVDMVSAHCFECNILFELLGFFHSASIQNCIVLGRKGVHLE